VKLVIGANGFRGSHMRRAHSSWRPNPAVAASDTWCAAARREAPSGFVTFRFFGHDRR
jgi:hypothetical protein